MKIRLVDLLLSGLIAVGPLAMPADAAFISYFGVPVTEDFDAMTAAGNTTTDITGWFAAAIGARLYTPGDPSNALPFDGRVGPFSSAYPAPPDADRLTSFSDGTTASDGNALGGLYNYGAVDNPDRALGLLASGSIIITNLHPQMASQSAALEMALINDSGTDLIGFDMTFTEEHWHSAQGAGSTPVRAFYSVDGGTVWTELPPEFSLIEVNATAFTNSGLDGNDPLLNQAPRGGQFLFPPGEVIADGSEFYIRWVDYNDAGITDMGTGIDDWLFVGIVPEPGVAMLFGCAGILLLRRRRG